MSKKLIIIIISSILAVGIVSGLFVQYNHYKTLYNRQTVNLKALKAEKDSLQGKSIVYEKTLDELREYGDSIDSLLLVTKDELGIKDKKLKAMAYQTATIEKVDTLILKDTLFRDRAINIDTLLQDDWYKLGLQLQFPNKVVVSPSFKSELQLFVSSKKETVEKPKRFFLLRWFQKKHTILVVDIKESNPYIKQEKNRFTEIIK